IDRLLETFHAGLGGLAVLEVAGAFLGARAQGRGRLAFERFARQRWSGGEDQDCGNVGSLKLSRHLVSPGLQSERSLSSCACSGATAARSLRSLAASCSFMSRAS